MLTRYSGTVIRRRNVQPEPVKKRKKVSQPAVVPEAEPAKQTEPVIQSVEEENPDGN